MSESYTFIYSIPDMSFTILIFAGLSAGAIVGIVIAITIIVLAVSLLGFFLFTRYQQGSLSSPGSINDPSAKPPTGFDNALYAASDSSGKVNLSTDA